MPLKVGVHSVSTLSQFNDLAATATAENKRLVAVLGERGYTIRVVSGHNLFTKLAGYLTGQTDRENLRLETFKNALSSGQGPSGAPTLLARRASSATPPDSAGLDTQSVSQDIAALDDDQAAPLPLEDLNTLLENALRDMDAASSQGTLRTIFGICMQLRRDDTDFAELEQTASLQAAMGSNDRSFKAHLLLNDLEKNFKHLSAAIDLSPGLKQDFQMYRPIIKQVLAIIEPHVSRLNRERDAIQGLHDDLSLHGLTMLKPSDASGSSSQAAMTIDFSGMAPGSELNDLLSRVRDARTGYAFESALARIDHKIEQLAHVTGLLKASAKRHAPSAKMFEGSMASWEFSSKTLREIRNRVKEAYQVQFPSQWQGSDAARLCGELVHSGPQICADLLMQVINPAPHSNGPDPAGIGVRVGQEAPLLAQFLAECPTQASIASQGRFDLARSSNCLGTLQAKINAAGQFLTAQRSQLTASTGRSATLANDYTEAISRLAALNVLLVLRTNQTVEALNTTGQYAKAVDKWSETLGRELRETQDLCHGLLNASPSPVVVMKTTDSRSTPVIARADGSYETGDFSALKNLIGESPAKLAWDFALANAWRSARVSDYRDDDHADQLQAGIDFLLTLSAQQPAASAAQ
jgi:hypothetical protein